MAQDADVGAVKLKVSIGGLRGASWFCSVSDPYLTSTQASISQAPEGINQEGMDVDRPFPPFLVVQLYRQLQYYGVSVGLRVPGANLGTESSPWRMQ